VKRLLILCLCCNLALPQTVSAYGAYTEANPFVEAMLRMMELFGLIDRRSLPSYAPYLYGYGGQLGLGGFPGFSPLSGVGGVPGLSPLYGAGGIPGMSAIPGAGGFPGVAPWPGSGLPNTGGLPGSWGGIPTYGQWAGPEQAGFLDGVWELDKGGFVVIRGPAARLYLDRERFQDFDIRYDRQHLWWAPKAGGRPSRYRYEMREGRMVLSDAEGNLLLLRRTR
jgi:hypothetical protein